MSQWQRQSATTLLAGHLRGELERGRWIGRMPGVIRLAHELGAARNTVEGALRELEREGLLLPQGHGQGRLIHTIGKRRPTAGIRVGILAYEESDRGLPLLIDLQHKLEEAGHVVAFGRKTLLGLRRDVKQVAKFVTNNQADAWVVISGAQEVLEWFIKEGVLAFALFGRRRELSIAGGGPDKASAMRSVVQRLVALGHRRIVLFVRSERRKPQPGAQERALLEELEACGIPTGPYQLPDWEESPEGLLKCLDGLLAVTPPTALIFDEPFLLVAAQHYFAQWGILAPRDVSLVCCDPPGAALDWQRPLIAHINWDSRPLARQIVKWIGNIAQGCADIKQIESKAIFVEGGTIGPVKGHGDR